jgi:hypothetical protein
MTLLLGMVAWRMVQTPAVFLSAYLVDLLIEAWNN